MITVPNSTKHRWVVDAAFAGDDEVECEYCGRQVFNDIDPCAPAFATVEHRVPLSRGGGDRVENISIACRQCNTEKGSLTLTEFMAVWDNHAARKRLQKIVGGLSPIDVAIENQTRRVEASKRKKQIGKVVSEFTKHGASRHCLLCKGSGTWPLVGRCPCTR